LGHREAKIKVLADINSRDIIEAVKLGCDAMSRCFNYRDNHVPFFEANLRPRAELKFSRRHSESHVPGRHLNALLNAEDVLKLSIGEGVIEKHARAAFFSYSGPILLPLNREEESGPLTNFFPHNIREGFHALYALAKFRGSSQAKEIAEKSIELIQSIWDPDAGWDKSQLNGSRGIEFVGDDSFVLGIARSIGPLVKYYRATGYKGALNLAVLLKEKALRDIFDEEGSFRVETFGTHSHSTTCTMSSLAQLADSTKDEELMSRMKSFYDNGLWEIRDRFGYSIENADLVTPNSGRGEINNSADILETALILGSWGHHQYYDDAERIIRSHILPTQLRDISWVGEVSEFRGDSSGVSVPERLRGAWGFPAPYGHEPIGLSDSVNRKVSFNLDIVGGAVGALCEAYRHVSISTADGHQINLLFDHETPELKVVSPYVGGKLIVTTKIPGSLSIRIPSWVDIEELSSTESYRLNGRYLKIPEPTVGRPISISFPMPAKEIEVSNIAGIIRASLRGDEVMAMSNFGADLTFFEPID